PVDQGRVRRTTPAGRARLLRAAVAQTVPQSEGDDDRHPDYPRNDCGPGMHAPRLEPIRAESAAAARGLRGLRQIAHGVDGGSADTDLEMEVWSRAPPGAAGLGHGLPLGDVLAALNKKRRQVPVSRCQPSAVV